MNIAKRGTMFSYIMAFALITMMVVACVLFDNHEFILPEIAAMVIAMWVYRDPNWLRRPLHICFAPTATSVIGLTVNHLHFAYLCKAGIAFACIMIFLRLIQSNFAPSLATGLLPLITNAHDWKLVLIVFISTFTLMLVVLVFRMNAGLDKRVEIRYKYSFVFLALIFFWMGICWAAGFEQAAVIPPIIVVAYESLQKPNYGGKAALKQGIALTVSATVGTLLFFGLNSWIMVTLLSLFFMLIMEWIMKIRMPAIYAFPLLPFIFPPDVVPALPLATLITSLFVFTFVTVYKKLEGLARHRAENTEVSM
ncbi:hypothetical protein ACM1RC_21930 [Paenibacillus azoreducens]|uniref:hypothetical protein n=1 Tax=Paenibacillus azoreducens TaxID=116718 RepID=UPI0039F45BE8